MGERATQDSVRPTLPAADVEGAEAGVRQVRERASGGGAEGEEEQAQGEERRVQKTDGRG